MAWVLSDLKYLAATDPAALAVQVQAECLQAFEQADAISTATDPQPAPRKASRHGSKAR